MDWPVGQGDNSQYGVFAALGLLRPCTCNPIDFRLYLPVAWTDDKERCLASRISEGNIVFKRKHDSTLDMVVHARSLGVYFNWVGCDGLYGQDPDFLRSLNDMGELIVDVYINRFGSGMAKRTELTNGTSLSGTK